MNLLSDMLLQSDFDESTRKKLIAFFGQANPKRQLGSSASARRLTRSDVARIYTGISRLRLCDFAKHLRFPRRFPMLTRRDFLARSLKASTLLACTPAVPQFLAATAHAAEQEKDGTVLVVLEMGGGNDGLNTVIPYGDDLYHKARPTLRFTKKNVMKVNDHIGLHNSLFGLQNMISEGQLAVVQGVGYPNPDRSHFESMDIWQSADVTRANLTGWLGRAVPSLHDKKGNIPALQVGTNQLPLASKVRPEAPSA